MSRKPVIDLFVSGADKALLRVSVSANKGDDVFAKPRMIITNPTSEVGVGQGHLAEIVLMELVIYENLIHFNLNHFRQSLR